MQHGNVLGATALALVVALPHLACAPSLAPLQEPEPTLVASGPARIGELSATPVVGGQFAKVRVTLHNAGEEPAKGRLTLIARRDGASATRARVPFAFEGAEKLIVAACPLPVGETPTPCRLTARLESIGEPAFADQKQTDVGPGDPASEAERRPMLLWDKPAAASSSQNGHPPEHAIDGLGETRWCAANASSGYWWQVDLGEPQALTGCAIRWEFAGHRYQYVVEGSADGSAWTILSDQRERDDTEQEHRLSFAAEGIRYVRIFVTGLDRRCWASFWEIQLFGE
jgi:hypothetical protein